MGIALPSEVWIAHAELHIPQQLLGRPFGFSWRVADVARSFYRRLLEEREESWPLHPCRTDEIYTSGVLRKSVDLVIRWEASQHIELSFRGLVNG